MIVDANDKTEWEAAQNPLIPHPRSLLAAFWAECLAEERFKITLKFIKIQELQIFLQFNSTNLVEQKVC